MRAEETVRLLKRAPFGPFLVHKSDGSSYPVKHPDQVIVTPRAVYVGIGGDGPQPVTQDVAIWDMVHMTRLGPVSKPGPKRRK